MTFINNVFRLNRQLNKKYRLAESRVNIEDFVDDENTPLEGETPASPPMQSTPGASSTPPAGTSASTPITGSTANPTSSTPKPPAPSPPKPKSKPLDSVVIPARDEDKMEGPEVDLNSEDKETKEEKLKGEKLSQDNSPGKLKQGINKTLGVALAVKNFTDKLVNSYKDRRMKTFLTLGGRFSPAMRAQIQSQSDQESNNFFQKALLSGNNMTLKDAERVSTLMDLLHTSKIPQEARQYVIEKMHLYNKNGQLNKYGKDQIMSDLKEFKEGNPTLFGKNSDTTNPLDIGLENLDPTERIEAQAKGGVTGGKSR